MDSQDQDHKGHAEKSRKADGQVAARPSRVQKFTFLTLQRHLPAYWRVTFDHPLLNIFGPETIPQLNETIAELDAQTQTAGS
jgi:hypothetical protein